MELSNAEWWDNEELQWLEREIQELEDELDGGNVETDSPPGYSRSVRKSSTKSRTVASSSSTDSIRSLTS